MSADEDLNPTALTRRLYGNRSAYRPEFMQVKDYVLECLDQGHTIRAVYAELRRRRKISCVYETFRTYIRHAQEQ